MITNIINSLTEVATVSGFSTPLTRVNDIQEAKDNEDTEDEDDVLCKHLYELSTDLFKSVKYQKVNPSYMRKQELINERHRRILVEWIIETHVDFEFTNQTLYRTVGIVDRYLSSEAVDSTILQLIGAVAFKIASKIVENTVVQVDDLVFICDGAYDSDDVELMEIAMLKELMYFKPSISPYELLIRYLGTMSCKTKLTQFAVFVLELTLLSYDMLRYDSYTMAAAAFYIARHKYNLTSWGDNIAFMTMTPQYAVREAALAIMGILDREVRNTNHSIYVKYRCKKLGGIRAADIKNLRL